MFCQAGVGSGRARGCSRQRSHQFSPFYSPHRRSLSALWRTGLTKRPGRQRRRRGRVPAGARPSPAPRARLPRTPERSTATFPAQWSAHNLPVTGGAPRRNRRQNASPSTRGALSDWGCSASAIEWTIERQASGFPSSFGRVCSPRPEARAKRQRWRRRATTSEKEESNPELGVCAWRAE